MRINSEHKFMGDQKVFEKVNRKNPGKKIYNRINSNGLTTKTKYS